MPFLAAAPIAAGGAAAMSGGAALASALIPAAVGAIGGLGSALINKSSQERQIEAQKEISMPGRSKVPLTAAQQQIAGNMGSGLGLQQIGQNTGIGFGNQGQSRLQSIGNRINQLRNQTQSPQAAQGVTQQNTMAPRNY